MSDKKTIMGVYKIENTKNNKFYVGASVDVLARWVVHKNSLVSDKHHNKPLQKDWNKYGPSVFKFIIIEEVFNKDDLHTAEKRIARQLGAGGKQGYNTSKVFCPNRKKIGGRTINARLSIDVLSILEAIMEKRCATMTDLIEESIREHLKEEAEQYYTDMFFS